VLHEEVVLIPDHLQTPHAKRFKAAAERSAKPPESLFLRAADWVSEAMGKPANIIFWFVLVVLWTAIFAANIVPADGSFLPSWFVGQGYNFPLNLLTTVAELFIGFLVAAAANRSQRVLSTIIDGISTVLDHVSDEVTAQSQLIEANTKLTQQVAEQTTQIQAQGHQIQELAQAIHDHITGSK